MRKNYKHSSETIEKIRKARVLFYEKGGKAVNGMIGKKHKPETLEKMRLINIVKGNHKNFGDTSGENNPAWKGGEPHRKETRVTYRKNHPEVESFNGTKRRAKLLDIPHNLNIIEFREWYASTLKVCVYCDLDISQKTEKRMESLSIDRKYNEIGYVKGNLCFACNRCNTVKGNTFTYDEMVEIGHRYIKEKRENV